MPRPDRLVVVVATATEVGKTWTTAAVARRLREQGVTVAARKPVQSFEPTDPVDGRDASLLAAATGESPETVCPSHRNYEVAMAPPMAAAALSRPPILLADLLDELTWTEHIAVGFVEAVGGLCSPMAEDGDGLALIGALDPDLVLAVAPAGLGVVNDVRLLARALGDRTLTVFLNRYDDADDLHRANRTWLTERDGLDVVTTVDELAARFVS
jgi:dethiobiotin synthetase